MNKQSKCGHETAQSDGNGSIQCLGCGTHMTAAQWEEVIDKAERAEEAKRAAVAPASIGQRICRALGLNV